MTFDLKTLVIFDTNRLREISGGEPSYGEFTLGQGFYEVNKFIQEKELEDKISIGVPFLVIDELLMQKIGQFESDLKSLAAIIQRMKNVPETSFDKVNMPDEAFDLKAHLETRFLMFLKENRVEILKIPEDNSALVLKSLIDRAIKKQVPFKQSDKSSDIGFKDVVLLEIILNSPSIQRYDKIILISGDKIFLDCKEEMIKKLNKHVEVTPSVQLVLVELEHDYSFFIENNKFIKFANSEYFKDYLSRIVSIGDTFDIDGEEWSIIKIKSVEYIHNLASSDEVTNEKSEQLTFITSKLDVDLGFQGREKSISIEVTTVIDQANDILSSDVVLTNDA